MNQECYLVLLFKEKGDKKASKHSFSSFSGSSNVTKNVVQQTDMVHIQKLTFTICECQT
jgi:hypothetical protein